MQNLETFLLHRLAGEAGEFLGRSDYLNDPPWEGCYVNRREFVKIRDGKDRLPQAFTDYLAEQDEQMDKVIKLFGEIKRSTDFIGRIKINYKCPPSLLC